ncbi:phosphoribosylanthranilate isomerase [Tardisphaera miroshnichenkoae]
MKVKFCGITNLEDAVKADKIGADMLGFVVQPGQARQASLELLEQARHAVKAATVAVRLDLNFMNMLHVADLFQIHKVLTSDELEALASLSARFILYVPASTEGLDYVRRLSIIPNAVPLIDSPVKGVPTDLKIAKQILDARPDSGLGGGITPDNVQFYVDLNPSWIDVSSGIEARPGKKDPEKMMKIVEAVKFEAH